MMQKRDGAVSDGDFIRDDDSSSLSERHGQERGRSKNNAKLAVRKFFRRISKRSSNAEEDVSGIDCCFARPSARKYLSQTAHIHISFILNFILLQ